MLANDQAVRIMCPALTCRKILAVPESTRGKTIRCGGCGSAIRVPGAAANEPASPEGKKKKAG